ncbi:MAG: sigma 54-interacting transcriptional regulator [Clostridiales bacterium]|nr:sigma 54-interacting transcriptional regulator [Clostridiales bacterium]
MEKVFEWHTIQKITEYISDGLQIVDKSGNLIFCNRKSAMLDDINIGESLGKHITKIYPSLDESNSTILKVLKTGQPILNLEQRYTTYLGNEIHTINSTIPLNDSRDKVIGAVEISKNITDMKKLSEQVVDLQKVMLGTEERFAEDKPLYRFEDIITEDPETIKMISRAMKAAITDASILVVGETGTGKELLVQAIHNSSLRRKQPFIVQNCAALPESLLEGILFGTLKGGFTGSINRPGLFEIANGGTLFLDEINSMPNQLQTKILRVIQDGKFRRIGDTRLRESNVRIIAAVNEDPFISIEKGDLRRDLFYRLNTITLKLNKLYERNQDTEVLTRYFIKKFNNKYFRHVKGVTKDVENILSQFQWPGNIRELEHVIEGAMSLLEGDWITCSDIPEYLKGFKNKMKVQNYHLRNRLEELEERLIDEVLEITDGNVSKTAVMLNIPRQTLQYKLKKRGAEK